MLFGESKLKLESNKCLFIFLLKYFFKSKIGPIISVSFPIIFMIIYFIINSSKMSENQNGFNNWFYFTSGLPTYIVLSIIPLAFITLPQTIVELKNSILLRKIKTSGFSKTEYILILFILYFVFSIVSCLISFIFFFIFLNVHFKEVSHFNYGNLIYSILMLIVSSLAFGIMLGSLMKNTLVTQFTGVAIFMISMMLGGLFMPINILGDVMAVRIIALFSPVTYATGLIQNTLFIFSPEQIKSILATVQSVDPSKYSYTTLGYDIFDFNHPFIYLDSDLKVTTTGLIPEVNEKILYYVWQKALNVVMPYVVSTLMFFVAIKKFSWYGR